MTTGRSNRLLAADKAGLAFGTLEDINPFLEEDRFLTMDALAVQTTSPAPPNGQGLIRVSNLRFPATYGPTMEAVLIDGSMVQLGDCSVVRKLSDSPADTKVVDTKTFKLTVWRDEWPGKWNELIASPVKKIIERTPRLLLCKGDRCGQADCDIDQVVVDLWANVARQKKLISSRSLVLLRIPTLCAEGLQQRSGQDGVYYEPRLDDGKGPATDFTVIRINGNDKSEALHRLRVTDRAVALARFGHRHGIRTMLKDAESVHREVNPDVPF